VEEFLEMTVDAKECQQTVSQEAGSTGTDPSDKIEDGLH
jgi:hypothetical protein